MALVRSLFFLGGGFVHRVWLVPGADFLVRTMRLMRLRVSAIRDSTVKSVLLD